MSKSKGLEVINKKRLLSLILLSIFLLSNFLCIKTSAQENDKYLKFINMSTNDGLSQGSVYAIHRDEDGYMWFGTNDGLNRFNGYDYDVIKANDKDENTLYPGIIGSIVEDKNGFLWIGTSSGLCKLDKKMLNVERIGSDVNDAKKTSNKHIWDLYIDSKNNLWVGTECGLNKYNFETKEFKKYFNDKSNNESLSNNFITSIVEGNNGEMYIATKDGLNILDTNTDKITRVPKENLPSGYIIKLYKDSRNNLWISTQNKGIVKLNLNTKKFNKLEKINKLYGFEKFAINDMYEDFQNNIWLGSKGGLIKYSLNEDKVERYVNNPYDNESLINNSIQSVYRDKDGLMWIGTYNGISIANPNERFIHYKKLPGQKDTLSGNSIGGIYEDKDGDMWIGTTNDGLNYLNRKTNKITHYEYDDKNKNSISSNTIFQVTGDNYGNIWVGTKNGLCRIDKKTGNVKRYKHSNNKNSLTNNDVKEVFVDDKGLLWIGTRDGLDVFDIKKEKFKNLNHLLKENNIGETFIRRIYEDSKGNYWLGTGWNGGLIKFDVKKQKVINYKSIKGNEKSISDNAVKGIVEDKDGNIWVTTSFGLNRLNPETEEFKVFTEEDGLANNYAYGVLTDKEDNIWVSTNGGLSKYDKKNNTFNNFTFVDGIQNNEFNGTAEYKCKDGEMFFGGINGVTAFYPENIKNNITSSQVTIGNFKVYNNKNIKLNGDSVTLKNNENTFSFEFFLPDYRRLKTINYEYMLEGFDKDWNFLDKRNYVRYTNIAPGNYVFKVRARDKNGNIGETKKVNIKINKPWYNSNLAYIIYFSILIAIVYFVLNYFKILNGLVKERTEELNKELLENEKIYNKLLKYEKFRNTYLVNLSHELRTPLNVILSSEQLISTLNNSESGIAKKDLDKYMKIIKKNSKTLLKVINDLIDSSKISSGTYKLNMEETDIVYLVEEVALSMKSYIESNGLELIIDPEVEEKVIECDKTNIERCVINLISNAVKFTEEKGTIFVGIEDHGDTVDIIIKDTGIGIPKEHQNIIFNRFSQVETQVSSKHCSSGIGLTLVKSLVELHNGKITLVSEVGVGSEFRITLKVKQDKEK